MSTLIDKYGEFFYGDKHFYGEQVIAPVVFSPTNFKEVLK